LLIVSRGRGVFLGPLLRRLGLGGQDLLGSELAFMVNEMQPRDASSDAENGEQLELKA
jgi:hypothetical protein